MSTQTQQPTLIVTGGGTGGHVFAGIAIAEAWGKKFPTGKVVFVGAEGGIEEKLVPRAGIQLELVRLGSLKGVPLKKKIKTSLQVPLSLFKAAWIIARVKPQAVVGVGGYASGPVVLIARILSPFFSTRVAILEQNAVPGFTNRILSRFSHLVLCAFPGIDKKFPGARTVVTGNPVRKEMTPLAPSARIPFRVFIFGGSQGALGINTLVLDALPYLEDLKEGINFVHQTGERDYDRVVAGYQKAAITGRIEKFIYEMKDAYQSASLVICRAGSSTLAEIAAVRRAAVLIPFPQASDNHQEMNARLFADQGASLLLLQQKSRGEDLAREIRRLIAIPGEITRMEGQVSSFYRPHAADDVVSALIWPMDHR
jgi:UDP-N-acetylglucosamine--N-acetylmuramyl-(pentapeptide) pyrophosphoryl-undecaprenol N-acetylglucosamine transferase